MTRLPYASNERLFAWLLALGALVGCAPAEPDPSLVHFYGPGLDAPPSTATPGGEAGQDVSPDISQTDSQDGSQVVSQNDEAGAASTGSPPAEQASGPAPTGAPATSDSAPPATMMPTGAQPPAEPSDGVAGGAEMTAVPMGGALEADEDAPGEQPASSQGDGLAAEPAPPPPEEEPAPMAPPPKELRVSITTATQRGRYAPVNVGVIWIEDSAGDWVYTLNYWNSELNSRHMARYNSVDGPAYVRNFFFLWVNEPPPDVVTSATLDEHETHVGTWHLKGDSGTPAPQGDYKVLIELTEEEGPGEVAEFPFTLGPVGMTWTPADTPYYKDIELVLQ